MDSDFRKPQQANDAPAPVTPPQRSTWQNDVISALHSSTVQKPATTVSAPDKVEPVAVKIDTAPTEDAGHSNVQPRQAEVETASKGPVVEPHIEPARKWDDNPVIKPAAGIYQPAGPEPAAPKDNTNVPTVASFVSSDESAGYSNDPLPSADYDAEVMPIAVVQVVSTRGVEYAMMTLALWLGATSLLGVLLSLINGGTSAAVLAFPASVLVVCLPVFSFFFLRLKKAELLNPELKVDPSKRRLTQFTQLIAFATCLFTLIAFVYFLISTISGVGGTSILKAILDVIAILVVAGGILAYYWVDEHKTKSGR